MEKKEIGKITHFFNKINVAVLQLNGTLEVGDTISIEGANTNFKQEVTSMQVEHEAIQKATKGMDVGMKVKEQVRAGDKVFKIKE